jgi:hypothetical protein
MQPDTVGCDWNKHFKPSYCTQSHRPPTCDNTNSKTKNRTTATSSVTEESPQGPDTHEIHVNRVAHSNLQEIVANSSKQHKVIYLTVPRGGPATVPNRTDRNHQSVKGHGEQARPGQSLQGVARNTGREHFFLPHGLERHWDGAQQEQQDPSRFIPRFCAGESTQPSKNTIWRQDET